MLKTLSPLLSPDLLHLLASMGHGDELVIGDANFPADSCALQEACVGASGWRRLLQFDATVHNVGAEALHIGPVLGEDLETNLF